MHRGMLIPCNIRELKSTQATVKMAITRKAITTPGINWEPRLAPSQELFYWYMQNRKRPDWWLDYVIKWKAEKRDNLQYGDAIRYVVSLLNGGLDVAIACFCTDYNTCHRSIVYAEVEAIMTSFWGDKENIAPPAPGLPH